MGLESAENIGGVAITVAYDVSSLQIGAVQTKVTEQAKTLGNAFAAAFNSAAAAGMKAAAPHIATTSAAAGVSPVNSGAAMAGSVVASGSMPTMGVASIAQAASSFAALTGAIQPAIAAVNSLVAAVGRLGIAAASSGAGSMGGGGYAGGSAAGLGAAAMMAAGGGGGAVGGGRNSLLLGMRLGGLARIGTMGMALSEINHIVGASTQFRDASAGAGSDQRRQLEAQLTYRDALTSSFPLVGHLIGLAQEKLSGVTTESIHSQLAGIEVQERKTARISEQNAFVESSKKLAFSAAADAASYNQTPQMQAAVGIAERRREFEDVARGANARDRYGKEVGPIADARRSLDQLEAKENAELARQITEGRQALQSQGRAADFIGKAVASQSVGDTVGEIRYQRAAARETMLSHQAEIMSSEKDKTNRATIAATQGREVASFDAETRERLTTSADRAERTMRGYTLRQAVAAYEIDRMPEAAKTLREVQQMTEEVKMAPPSERRAAAYANLAELKAMRSGMAVQGGTEAFVGQGGYMMPIDPMGELHSKERAAQFREMDEAQKTLESTTKIDPGAVASDVSSCAKTLSQLLDKFGTIFAVLQ